MALLLVVAYALFAHGATDTPAETRVQLALAVTALVTVAALAGDRGALRLGAGPVARAGALLLFAFAAWCALSVAWSVAPDRTWTEVNRAVAYALMAGLALVLGSSLPRAVERVATAWLALAVVVALYALGGKTLPGVNIPGILDLNQTADLARLRAPLQYWNALALVLAMGVPVALRIATDRTRPIRARVAAVLAVYLFALDLGMTYSRGGFLALGTAMVVLTVLGGARLRALVALGAAAVAATIPLAVAFSRPGLTGNGTPLGVRIHDGRVLTVTIVVAALMLVGGVRVLLALEGRVRWTAARTRTVGRGAAVVAAGVLLLTVMGATASSRGLPGTVHEAVRGFTTPTEDKQFDPSRLASTTSGNRWVWWKEAAGAFSDRPLGGWGAGSFRVVHLRYRTNTIAVTQPHSVPLQFLAETGLIGLLLAYGGIGALLWAGIARIRRMALGRERDLAVALLAAVCGWLAHGAYDWDWDIPGVTLVAFLLLGVLAADGERRRPPTAAGPVVIFADPEREGRLRPAALAGIVAATVALLLYATSAVLPAWSAGKADDAQAAIGGDTVTDDQLRRAAAEADLAVKLDPLGVEPLLVSAAIAQRRGRLLDARAALLRAVRRQPDNVRAWSQLATLALTLADRQGFETAEVKALALDPHNPALRVIASRAVAFRTPPGDSATATGTPLAAQAAAATPAPIPGGVTTVPGAGIVPGTTTVPGLVLPPAVALPPTAGR